MSQTNEDLDVESKHKTFTTSPNNVAKKLPKEKWLYLG